ncbi:acyl dehydratase [Roseiarcus fermentans]|uniref:Acyl dehydratase n=1 Tax=Roseiarcus fermentans TaxID=1473586 RepID=A0A366ELY2_9HYPH|nr:MaoC family dehydratase N-terminal domain-containing protein [Roseiarcus fermentans]RBP02455.1 acyl dehydratase [Roseiarcus fermentans]
MVDASTIGMTFEPTRACVEPGRLRFFLDTIGETNPIYRDAVAAKAAGFAARPIPPTYLFCLEMIDNDGRFAILEALNIDIARILHGEQTFIYRAPAYVGDELTFHSSVTDVRQKKGGALTLVDVATHVTNQRGEPVADCVRVVVVRNQGGLS